ncbi:hypothetical protein FRC09_004290 [Ceratobasidium sp. 395]|nr:hypothetical protein FRC09_004290 [Ceratobasidium sp. 395]
MASVKNSIHWPKESNRVVNSDDSQALSRAYSGLLFVWKQNGWSTKSLPVDFLGHLTAFVLHVHGHNLSTSAQERIETIEIALQFLWMVLGDRGRIPLSDHSKVREFAIAVFSHLWNTQQRITTREEQYMIAQALAEVEFTALAGRVLLMILDEGNEFQNTESFTDLLDGIHAFQEVIDKSVSVSPGLLIDSEIEWGKRSELRRHSFQNGIGDLQADFSNLEGLVPLWAKLTNR